MTQILGNVVVIVQKTWNMDILIFSVDIFNATNDV